MLDVVLLTALKSFMTRGSYAISHLPCRPLGKGDRHKLVEVGCRIVSVSRLKPSEKTLCQDKGFAATSPGRQGDRHSPSMDCRRLLVCKLGSSCHVKRPWCLDGVISIRFQLAKAEASSGRRSVLSHLVIKMSGILRKNLRLAAIPVCSTLPMLCLKMRKLREKTKKVADSAAWQRRIVFLCCVDLNLTMKIFSIRLFGPKPFRVSSEGV